MIYEDEYLSEKFFEKYNNYDKKKVKLILDSFDNLQTEHKAFNKIKINYERQRGNYNSRKKELEELKRRPDESFKKQYEKDMKKDNTSYKSTGNFSKGLKLIGYGIAMIILSAAFLGDSSEDGGDESNKKQNNIIQDNYQVDENENSRTIRDGDY